MTCVKPGRPPPCKKNPLVLECSNRVHVVHLVLAECCAPSSTLKEFSALECSNASRSSGIRNDGGPLRVVLLPHLCYEFLLDLLLDFGAVVCWQLSLVFFRELGKKTSLWIQLRTLLWDRSASFLQQWSSRWRPPPQFWLRASRASLMQRDASWRPIAQQL